MQKVVFTFLSLIFQQSGGRHWGWGSHWDPDSLLLYGVFILPGMVTHLYTLGAAFSWQMLEILRAEAQLLLEK